ncbi:MAG: sigma-70 family RNA polymerase sigma factor [Ruminococcaceae bacterium]|nr:sigma-70 family RNA polymerase sigma factor [Oscillospiraceae bacterium]
MFASLLELLSHITFFALHLMNPGSFPRPLTAEQERDALRRFHEDGDMQARSQLIEHNLRLVAHIVKKYQNVTHDQDDLISIGTIGLIKAVGTFDHTKGTRLATYASRCIENEILMYFRANKKTAQDVSLSEPIDTDKDGHPLSLLDVIADDDTLAEDLELKVNSEKLRRYIAEVLDEREREVIEWRYGLKGDGMAQREVAKKLGISRSYVSRIEKKALEKLHERFERV